MTRYRSSISCGMTPTARLGQAMDRAPRPYTAAELAEITGVPILTVAAFLRTNTHAEHISRRDITRDNPHEEGGKPLREYWRGDRTVYDTFSREVGIMDEKTGRKLEEGSRPVSWRDGARTVWSIDETETVSAMRGNNVVRMGKAESVRAVKAGYSIRIKDGPILRFRKEGGQ